MLAEQKLNQTHTFPHTPLLEETKMDATPSHYTKMKPVKKKKKIKSNKKSSKEKNRERWGLFTLPGPTTRGWT